MNALVTLAISLTMAAAARDSVTSPAFVAVAEPRVTVVERSELRSRCRADVDVDGCTDFRGEVLRCACGRDGSGSWKITAVAQVVPYMYVVSPRLADHERAHIDDVAARLAEYLEDLTRRRFDQRADCAIEARFEERSFTMRMDSLRQQSNLLLH